MPSLTIRQKTILDRTIEVHIDKAQPVGSRLLTEAFDLGYSPATVRHEMGALESMGYLTQPHVSSGRVPTDSGYRYYVDHCLEQDSEGETLEEDVFGDLLETPGEIAGETIAEVASDVLASLLGETGLVVLVRKSPQRVARGEDRRKLFLQGTSHMLEKPEFQDLEKVRPIFKAFEEKVDLIDWVSRQTHMEDVSVSIGHENEPASLWECSLISAAYYMEDQIGGSIAVIGARRMDYARSISLVSSMADLLGRVMVYRSG